MLTIAEEYLPATLTVPEMTDSLFSELAESYDQCRLEYFGDALHLRPFADRLTSACSAMVLYQVFAWWRSQKRGYVTESRCGYFLPDGSRLFPAVAWIPGPESDPKFVVDVLSPRDRVELSRAKMQIWLANGVELGWMIEPQRRAITVYRPNREPEVLIAPDSLVGEGSIEGFVLDVASIWV